MIEAEREREELWHKSVRAHNPWAQTARALEWYRYHKEQSHRHRVLSDALVARHENEGLALHVPWAPKTTGHRGQHR